MHNIVMRIPQLEKYRGRNPNGYFEDLPFRVRERAYHWLHRLCQKWGANLPPWRLAILIGQAKRLASTTPEERSKWGRSMLAKRGGLAVQRRYRLEGRHPTAHATRCRVMKQAAKKRAKEDAKWRKSMGLPPPARIFYLPLD
jgi:hypothetical protein